MEQDNLPKHIAIIMDGNRRWAKNKNLPVSLGHKEGAKTLEKVVRYANKIGIKYISLNNKTISSILSYQKEKKTYSLYLNKKVIVLSKLYKK